MLLNLFTLLLILFNEHYAKTSKLLASTTVKVGICPLKCNCQEDLISVICRNLTRVEVRQLFASGGTFPTQFASSIQNLTILDSEFERMELLPRMDRLLALSLRGNQLERVGFESPDSDVLRPFFPALIFIDLSFNRITSIPRNGFLQFPNLEEIYMNNNRIFSIDWEAFRLFKLKRLFLNDNYLLMISEHMLRYSPSIEELDLSKNQLAIAQSSSFFAAQRLKSLNLSHNRLQRFDYDSFSPLFQLESLDLSYNNFSSIPTDLRQFVALRMLNFSGNPIQKLAEGELVQPMLQTLDLSFCPLLRLVEQQAFAMTPNLQFLRLANNPQLQFISAKAFRNNSLLFEIDLHNNSLSTLNQPLLDLPTRVFLRQNPLECACIWPMLKNYTEKLVDLKMAECKLDAEKKHTLLSDLDGMDSVGECPSEPILPFGSLLSAQVGEFFSLYCAPRNSLSASSIQWILPNGDVLADDADEEYKLKMNKKPAFTPQAMNKSVTQIRVIPHGIFNPVMPASKVESSYLGGIYPPLLKQHLHQRLMPVESPTSGGPESDVPHQKPRVQMAGEQLRFEVLMAEDGGEYICRMAGTEARIQLKVESPNIEIKPMEIGSHYVSLFWNNSLKIRSYERVQFSLQIQHSLTGQIGRVIQLNLHNPWHSYNVVRLRPLTNYTFCLVYSLRPPNNLGNRETGKLIYKTCVDVQTAEQIGFWSSLSPTFVGIMMAFCFAIFSLLCFRAIYLRFYIWHEAKLRARMNQSMSGQSFLSHTSSQPQHHPNGNGCYISQSSTFDSTAGQILNKSTGKFYQNGLAKGKRKKKGGSGKAMLLFDNNDDKEKPEDIALC